MKNRLQEKYSKEIKPTLQKELGVNVHQVPKVEKVVVNSGVGRAANDSKQLEAVLATLTTITGQKPVTTAARHSIAGFKLREESKIGAKVTLRGDRMYHLLYRLISVALPRIRDFRGVSVKAFDKQGNYSVGVTEQQIFPEISFEDASNSHGLQINIITSARSPEESKRLLELMGFPFRRIS
ncbi:MAG TPA: 50S ribosomal protein L5 [Candidatus Dormibacteraeota bacterium]|nr:50S ribosomal protein L5 [Candidatus Dormibacteraeota bacterium]